MEKNVSDCKHTKDALLDANLLLNAIFEASPLPTFVIDPDGIVRMWNRAAVQAFGWTAEEAIGSPLHIVPPEKREQHLSLLERISRGEMMTDVELERRRKDGSPIHVSLSTAPIKDIDGMLKGIISITADITGKKKAEEERAAMFHMLTHDIKGPLSVIYGYSEISSKISPDESARIMADIQKAGRRIYAIIDDILSLSRLESNEPQLLIRPVSLPELVAQAIKENEAGAAERDITIRVENAAELPRIYADPDLLGRAIGNLMANALSFSKKGGCISVSTGMAKEQANRVFIEVADNGDGIPDEDIPHLFDKYYRGKRPGKKRGSGLGLAIVKAAVDAHEGSVSLKSNSGEGSTFIITLPVKPGM
jgi:PAS domain S-box-containing protein